VEQLAGPQAFEVCSVVGLLRASAGSTNTSMLARFHGLVGEVLAHQLGRVVDSRTSQRYVHLSRRLPSHQCDSAAVEGVRAFQFPGRSEGLDAAGADY